MKRNRHTHIHNHTRGNRVGIRELTGAKKQVIGIPGKEKLQKEELLTIGNMLIEELENKTLSLTDLPDRSKQLFNNWPEVEDVW